MDLHLHLGEGGLAEQIYAQLHERISTDALPAGTVLPSSAWSSPRACRRRGRRWSRPTSGSPRTG